MRNIIFFTLFCILYQFKIWAQDNLTNGLILCYPFNKNYNDAAGNGYHAGKSNTQLVSDRFERAESACEFIGNSSFIEINPTPFKIDYFSISLWVKIDQLPQIGQPEYIWSCGSNDGEQSIILERDGSQVKLKVGGAVSQLENIYCDYLGFKTGQWYHIVFLREPNNLYLFINGNQVCSQPNIGKSPYYGTDFPRVYLGTGKRTAGLKSNLNGIIDDVHIYARVLTAFEIKKLFEGEKQPEIELTIDQKNPCMGDKIKLNVKGAPTTANFIWKMNKETKETYSNIFEYETNSQQADYELNVSDLVKVKLCSELINLNIPTIFTPNGDGVNDTWQIPNLDRIPEATITIYNRNGTVAFSSKGYPKPWDGTINGIALQPDTFDYVIATKIKGEKALKGSVILMR
jgi:gliding motility-associated-like protein